MMTVSLSFPSFFAAWSHSTVFVGMETGMQIRLASLSQRSACFFLLIAGIKCMHRYTPWLSFKEVYLFLVHVSDILPAFIYVHCIHVWCPWRPEEGLQTMSTIFVKGL